MGSVSEKESYTCINIQIYIHTDRHMYIYLFTVVESMWINPQESHQGIQLPYSVLIQRMGGRIRGGIRR
jgi:hypothetical protein